MNHPVPSPAGVFVLGMHRSGTSVISRTLNLLGLRLGPEDDLMPATGANAHGFWESTSLTAYNDSLLVRLGGRWDIPPAATPDEVAHQLAPQNAPALHAFQQVYGAADGAAAWLWKDPRNCLLVPFWERLLGLERSPLVLAYRHPLEVARSLAARDGFPLPLGLALWETYTRQALSAAEGRAAFVASYDRLVAAPLAWCEQAQEFLVATGLTDGEGEPQVAAAATDAGVRHAAHSRNELVQHPAVSRQQVALFDLLEEVAGVHEELRTEPGKQTPWVPVLHEARRQSLQPRSRTKTPWQRAAEQVASQEPSVDISVCILTNGGGQELVDCLQATLDDVGTYGALDVVVVDNGTTDETFDILGALSRDVRSIRHERPVDAATAWASGAATALGRVILLLTTDARLGPGSMQILRHQADLEDGPVCPVMANAPKGALRIGSGTRTTSMLIRREHLARADEVPVVVSGACAHSCSPVHA